MTRKDTHSHPGNRTAAGFLKEESGSVTIFAIAGFATCLVVTGLAFDVGRLMSIHSQASSYADQAALAAAGELDGRFANGTDNALVNAVNAAVGLGAGQRMTLGSGDGSLRISRIRFFSDLAANPGTCADSGNSNCPKATWTAGGGGGWGYAGGFTAQLASLHSKFVLVDLQPVTEDFLLLPLMSVFGVSGQQSATIPAAQSMAGFERRVCNVTPIMVCNPEDTSTVPGPLFDPNDLGDYTFKLQGRRRDGETNPWGPGVYSFLKRTNTSNNASASTMRDYIRRSDPNTVCYGDTGTAEPSPNAGGGNDSDNTRYQIGRGWNERWDQGRSDASRLRFPVAVVNCMDNRTALEAGRAVPIAGYAQAELRRAEHSSNEAVDLDDSDHDDEIRLRNLGMIRPSANPENNREFPVLVR